MQRQNIITIEKSKSRRALYYDTSEVRKNMVNPCNEDTTAGTRGYLEAVLLERVQNQNNGE